MEQCGVVFPTWIHIGFVQWVGSPSRERLLALERKRCDRVGERVEDRGLVFHRCKEHS